MDRAYSYVLCKILICYMVTNLKWTLAEILKTLNLFNMKEFVQCFDSITDSDRVLTFCDFMVDMMFVFFFLVLVPFLCAPHHAPWIHFHDETFVKNLRDILKAFRKVRNRKFVLQKMVKRSYKKSTLCYFFVPKTIE